MSTKKKALRPTIGTIFSSDSSDGEKSAPSGSVSARESKPLKEIKIRIPGLSDGHVARSDKKEPVVVVPEVAPDGYSKIDKTQVKSIRNNTLIQYEKQDGKIIKPKYFKKYDHIANTIVVGFYLHNKRNYSESLDNIKTIFANSKKEESDQLKETIEVPNDQWKTLRRDMVISYEKEDGEFVYRAKFNSFLKGPDGSSRMSLTSERGFNFVANPIKISKIYRHVTGNDKTLTFILEAMRKMDSRVRQLEAIIAKQKR